VTLALQYEPVVTTRDSLLRVLARTRSAVRGEGKQLALGLGVLMFGAHLSIPFYAPYMLKTLGLGYDGFTLLCAVQLLVKSVALAFMDRLSARFGLPRLLVGSVVLVAAVAWLWGASSATPTLVFAQALSGLGWAAYEFASFQLLLRASKPSQRVEFLAFAASVGGLFQLAGALSGSWLLTHAGFGYRDVFHVSAFVRMLPLFLLLPLVSEGREAAAVPVPVLVRRGASALLNRPSMWFSARRRD
jgi:MFS family permease